MAFHPTSVRFAQEELKELRATAKRLGMGLGPTIRLLVRQAMGEDLDEAAVLEGYSAGLRQFHEELRKVSGRFKSRGRQP